MIQAAVTGLFLAGPGHVLIGVSSYAERAIGCSDRRFLRGLLAQYGVVDLEQLAAMYPQSVEFRQLADRIVADLAAADGGAG